jgi:hypothetical protein
MENKQWNFKIPGHPDGKEIVIGTNEITTVSDLLDMLRNEETQTLQKAQDARLKPKRLAAVIPFVSRMQETRRHPSA